MFSNQSSLPDFLRNLILYKDDSIIVINKPAGLAVHKGHGTGENLEQYLEELCFDYPSAPMLAHRLDRYTSGCLILGRNKEALGKIGKIFMARRISKTYWTIVEGNKFKDIQGRIDIPLRKQSALKNSWWMEAHPEGHPSITDYKVMGASGEFTFLELYPRTGRTHQLRVHCQWAGCPIIGDKVYGNGTKNGDITLMHLHARGIIIPIHDKPSLEIFAPPPEHMLDLLGKCGYQL